MFSKHKVAYLVVLFTNTHLRIHTNNHTHAHIYRIYRNINIYWSQQWERALEERTLNEAWALDGEKMKSNNINQADDLTFILNGKYYY